jgi:hypothetical protein
MYPRHFLCLNIERFIVTTQVQSSMVQGSRLTDENYTIYLKVSTCKMVSR